MKRINILVTTLILVTFFSCDEASKGSKESQITKLRIENYLDTIQKSFKNYTTNTVIRKELNDFVKSDFKSKLNSGIFNDLPLKLNKVEKCNSKYVLKLEHSLTSKYYDRGLLNALEIEIYAETDEKTAKQLTENKFYLIEATFKEYITFQNNESYCAYSLMSPFMGFSSGISDNEIQFGAIGVKLKTIKPFTE